MVERELGTPLPADWKALVEAYGYGTFCDFLHLWSPFFAECSMIDQALGALDADRQLAKVAKDAVPFARFPEPDGALPFANTDNGDVAYWLCMGAPHEWPVALWNPRGGSKFELFDGGVEGFLRAYLPKIGVHGLWFDPWRRRVHQTITLTKVLEPPEDLEGTEYAWRLRALIAAMEPVVLRGGYGDEDDERRQVHFVARDGAWRVTYDTVYGHNLRFAAPAEDMEAAHARLDEAVRAMGCSIAMVIG